MRWLKKTVSRLFRWAIALALVPILWSVCHRVALMAPLVVGGGLRVWGFYALGVGGYIAVERIVARPMWLYVFGHELTHAVTGLLSGAKLHSFRATAKGGEVELSKSNVVIALSPYVIPLYAVLLIVAYAVTRRWWNPPALAPAFQILLGAAIAFHFSLTFSAIHSRQSDLKVVGFVLSGTTIALGNALILGLLAVSLFPRTPTLRQFALETTRETSRIYARGLQEASAGFNRLNAPPATGLTTTKKDRIIAWTH